MSTIRVKKIYKDPKGNVLSERVMSFTKADWDVIRNNPQVQDGAVFELMPTKVKEVEQTNIIEPVIAKPVDIDVKADATEVIEEVKPEVIKSARPTPKNKKK